MSMDYESLLLEAKKFGIENPEDMTEEDLITTIRQRQMIEAVRPKKLVRNTNLPWKRKYYFLDVDRYVEVSAETAALPPQVSLLLRYMHETGITSVLSAQTGGMIAAAAINKGYVKSKIAPHALFAYYRKVMEGYGLVFAGYNLEA